MKIAIIGCGFTGLSAGYRLAKMGHELTIFEKDAKPGGLALGYKKNEWDWTLEKHYHHWFTNDTAILNLAKELRYETTSVRPKTSIYYKEKSYQLDSPIKVLTFPILSVPERLRMAIVLGVLRYDPFWQPLERINANTFLKNAMGKKPYEIVWEPQLKNKFGQFANEISLAWFWARVKKRTPSLVYPNGGFLDFAETLVTAIKKQNAKILFNARIEHLESENKPTIVYKTHTSKTERFDKVIVTLPSFGFAYIAPSLPKDYILKLLQLKGLGALNIVLRLKQQFLTDDTYWLSICEKNAPVLAIVEHTNFMDKKHYNNEHLVYLGNYLPLSHPYFSMSKKELLKNYNPFLQKIHKDYEKDIIGFDMFQAPFAQPIIPTNYSKMILPFVTPLKNVYLANMQQVYPWDRGTNYAVELGEKIANHIVGNP